MSIPCVHATSLLLLRKCAPADKGVTAARTGSARAKKISRPVRREQAVRRRQEAQAAQRSPSAIGVAGGTPRLAAHCSGAGRRSAMVDFTSNQWAILFLVLVLGWLLGMMSRSGGAKWRRAAADERAAHDATRAELKAAHARIAELERERPVVVEKPAVVTEKTVVTKEPVVTREAVVERPVETRAERAIVDGEEDIP
jgi:hypothetical protein